MCLSAATNVLDIQLKSQPNVNSKMPQIEKSFDTLNERYLVDDDDDDDDAGMMVTAL